jgi:hypothetical protein
MKNTLSTLTYEDKKCGHGQQRYQHITGNIFIYVEY